MKNLPVKVHVNEYCDRLAKHLVSECFKQLGHIASKSGSGVADKVTVNFLSDYTEAVVFRVLAEIPAHIKSNREAYEFSVKNLGAWKRDMQEGIAAGFARAMTAYAGKDIEYVCTIVPVPEVNVSELSN